MGRTPDPATGVPPRAPGGPWPRHCSDVPGRVRALGAIGGGLPGDRPRRHTSLRCAHSLARTPSKRCRAPGPGAHSVLCQRNSIPSVPLARDPERILGPPPGNGQTLRLAVYNSRYSRSNQCDLAVTSCRGTKSTVAVCPGLSMSNSTTGLDKSSVTASPDSPVM